MYQIIIPHCYFHHQNIFTCRDLYIQEKRPTFVIKTIICENHRHELARANVFKIDDFLKLFDDMAISLFAFQK